MRTRDELTRFVLFFLEPTKAHSLALWLWLMNRKDGDQGRRSATFLAQETRQQARARRAAGGRRGRAARRGGRRAGTIGRQARARRRRFCVGFLECRARGRWREGRVPPGGRAGGRGRVGLRLGPLGGGVQVRRGGADPVRALRRGGGGRRHGALEPR